jgi:hypothetical protein
LALTIGFPALAIGGVLSWVVPVFVALTLALIVRHSMRSSAPMRTPPVALVFGVLALATLVQWLPIPGIRSLFAPGLERLVSDALAGSTVSSPSGLSVTRADTGLEVARMAGLTVLVIASAQVSWRIPAAIVAAVATLVALVGFTHEFAGTDAIYGLYQPVDGLKSAALRGTFVNPNHQSGLLLLGIFCAAAGAQDLHIARARTTDAERHQRYGDWLIAAIGALFVLVPALILSLSRAALIAFVLLGPIAAWLGLRGSRRRRRSSGKRRTSTPRIIVGLALLMVVLVVSQHRAWGELQTLADLSAEAPKLRMIQQGLHFIGLSPVLGVGRGAFIDLYPPVAATDKPLLYTHLESAPVAAMLEWGPVIGAAAVLALAAWWVRTYRTAGERKDAVARRIVLLGLAAVGLQQCADFGFEFLGLAAPATALAGALSTRTGRSYDSRRVRNVASAVLVASLALALSVHGRTWTHRETINAAIVAGKREPAAALRDRPLDGRLHGAIARLDYDHGDLDGAFTRAQVATQRFPSALDPWLVLAACHAARNEPEQTREATRQALDRLHTPPSEELTKWLLQRFPNPASLADVAPDDRDAWTVLMVALRERAPDHADALAAAWSRAHPDDALAYQHRAWIARHRGRAGLALHHARMLQAAAPGRASSYLVLVQALEMFEPPRTSDIIDALEDGLTRLEDDDMGRGQLEQLLIEALVERSAEGDLERARELADDLLNYPTPDREVRKTREQLVRRVSSG